MIKLRQSTASQEVPIGRFLDSTDGNTEETGLTIANTDVKIWKSGATSVVDKNSGGATHMAGGLYYIVLDATDTNTVGPLRIDVHVSGALAVTVWAEVLAPAVYDWWFGTSAPSTYAGADTSGTTTLLDRLTALRAGYLDNISTAPPTADAITDAVWDEVLTGASHNVPNSAGRKLRQLASTVVIDGTAQGGTGNTIQLAEGASALNGAYDPGIVTIMTGTGAGQSRLILEYNGATRTAIVDRDWRVAPDATSEYVIFAAEGREHVNEGKAQAGGASSITLNANASDANGAYVGQVIFLRSGTGEDQARRVTAYVGATKVATVDRPWDVQPDSTTGYVMLPTAVTDGELDTLATIASGVAALDARIPADPADESLLEAAIATRAAPGDAMALTSGERTTLGAALGSRQVGPVAAATQDRMLLSILAALLAKTSGGGTSSIILRNLADSANLASVTVDENDNRTAVTLTWENA